MTADLVPPPPPDSTSSPSTPRPGATDASRLPALLKRLGPAAVLGLVAAVLPAISGILLLVYIDTVSGWFQSLGDPAIIVYVGVFMIFSGLALLPTYSQTVLGGWMFGFALGYPAALAGFTGGAFIGFLVARYAARDRVEAVLQEKPVLSAVRDALVGSRFFKTLGIVALIRMPPNSPFALTNLVLASTRTPILPYLLGTLIGMAPRTALGVYIGVTIRHTLHASINSDTIKQVTPWWVLWAGGAAFLVALVVIGRIANQAILRIARQRPPAGPGPAAA